MTNQSREMVDSMECTVNTRAPRAMLLVSLLRQLHALNVTRGLGFWVKSLDQNVRWFLCKKVSKSKQPR